MNNACINYVSRKNFTLFSDDERELFRPYVVLYMSYAGLPIHKVQFDSAFQVRSVVQQVALTLAVAEAALQFEHRALSPAHVLVRPSHDQVVSFWLDGRSRLVDSFGVQASIADFSMARILPPGGQDPHPLFSRVADVPQYKRDALGATFSSVSDAIREDPSQFWPWTNVAYLQELTKAMLHAYEGRFADVGGEGERQAWGDVCFWLSEMPHFSSAKEFALDLVAQSARPTSSLSTL
ncbi:serine/threonine-protein kinase haspin-like [Haemaphysalis longicornis]